MISVVTGHIRPGGRIVSLLICILALIINAERAGAEEIRVFSGGAP